MNDIKFSKNIQRNLFRVKRRESLLGLLGAIILILLYGVVDWIDNSPNEQPTVEVLPNE